MTREDMQKARDRIKKRLRRFGRLEAERLQIEEQIKRLEFKMYSPGTTHWGGEPRGSSDGDPMAAAIQQKDRLVEKYNTQVARLLAEQQAIEEMIERLSDPTDRKLLRHRYIECLSWEGVCKEMGYEWSQTHRIHSRALDGLIEKEEMQKCD